MCYCVISCYLSQFISYSKSKARLHLPKDATFYDYLSAEYAEDEVVETLIDPLSAEGMTAMQDSSSSSKKGHRKGGSSSYEGGDELFADADGANGDSLLWDDRPISSSKSIKKNSSKKGPSKGSKDTGAAGGEDDGSGSSSGRTMRAKCWMAQDFPMKLTQLLPLLNVIGTANKHLEKVSKFLSKYSDMDMFPVKVQVRNLGGGGRLARGGEGPGSRRGCGVGWRCGRSDFQKWTNACVMCMLPSSNHC